MKKYRNANCPSDGDLSTQSHRRFEEACEMIQRNASKFIDQEWAESSSDEEDEVDVSVLQKTWLNYNDNEHKNLQKVKDYLQEIITHGAITCLICIESVGKKEKIWNCQNCYCVLHLSCIMKWAKDSLYSSNTDEKKSFKWSCPKCRFDYLPSDKPSKYFCFCKKVENPSFDTWGVPHSCGKICEKRLVPDCGHSCSLLCHPGPCPPCPKTVAISCCCLKSKAALKRCSYKEWTCGTKCQKVLPCNVHYCQELCHKGFCPPCKLQKIQTCECGAKSQSRPCTDVIWKCDKVCNKPLECGNHFCNLVCHSGPCSPCPNSGERHCPCGKKKMMLPCTENVLPCGDTCNKLLLCTIHQCSQRCHFGPCEECIQMQFKKCRCGLREKSVPCSKEYLCDTKCKGRRDCGRHNCNRKCCTGNCPPCEVPCGKTLKCGKHKCTSLCHTGPCYPCKEKVTVSCNCGSSKVVVPCGRKKSTVPPQCHSECKLPPDCHHSKRHTHKCHYGKCPPCRLPCCQVLECGHTCPAKCHSAVITKVDTKEKMEGPWDLQNAFRFELVSKPCPSCLIPVQVKCLGGHENTFIPCYNAKSVSCGKLCDRALTCGNHRCKLECHDVKDRTNFEESDNCESCSEICQKPRKCIHPCLLPCHPGQCKPCNQRIKMKCHCQMTQLYVLCDEWSSKNENECISMLSCLNRCPKQMSCSHRCILSCHAGECASRENCKKKVSLRCPCKRIKKEVICSSLINNESKIICDQECFEYQNLIKESEMKKASEIDAERKRQQENELKEFLRKTDGKKKRRKKQTETFKTRKEYSLRQLGAFAFLTIFLGIIIYYCVNF
ncbi:NF-X1-type zinc finger protein NFXL1 [Parasteatoda tepidariorum]|uniref:NF-X1-type zinc finger protein NFXL1 n=1 Tax=Parasteatoda tepidariorum TaxID=114398 RepID=UPI001C724A8B|nr:NF-X1-type zinc finger protein NFXL1 [Parasteatoda tepidariorum]XP_015921380.2 NF-X1-type zinc finger protein NFXL1 [Parasteatoda tepidariorum]XP_015921381.2 NF-X1-type zinc finger protein NFXL1 [Parasteatoda tepidariorum]